MTTPTDATTGPTDPTPTDAAPTEPPPAGSRLVPSLIDALIVGAWFVVVGLVGALVWVQVVDLPKVTRSGGNATVPSEELVKQVGIDSWFAVIALVAGLLSGVLLLAWRRRDPLLTVTLVALGGGLASWLMIHVGKALGPANEITALRKLSNGSHVSEQLRLHAPGVAWVWPIAAAFGALIYLWVLSKPGGDDDRPVNLR
jgi:hypothetical protein